MSYRQLFLLILTIWTAELFSRFLFDVVLPPQVEYKTFYLATDNKGEFRGNNIPEQFGDGGWELVSAVPNPENAQEMILFLQRKSVSLTGW
jgi:hypothetical protein